MIILSTLLYFTSRATIYATPIVGTSPPDLIDVKDSLPRSVLDDAACSCPQLRSVSDIVWSCMATIFACTWVSIHPNSPGSNIGRFRSTLTRVELMIWAILIPEMMIFWAFRQWRGARRLAYCFRGMSCTLPDDSFIEVTLCNILTEFNWTTVHGHFLQMGGFMLMDGNEEKHVLGPIDFTHLLQKGQIKFPCVSRDEINALSKGDGFSKMIVVGQTSWFIAQCISRAAQGLQVTQLELVTVALAFLNGLMYFLWWNKPLNPSSLVRIPICSEITHVSSVFPSDFERERITDICESSLNHHFCLLNVLIIKPSSVHRHNF